MSKRHQRQTSPGLEIHAFLIKAFREGYCEFHVNNVCEYVSRIRHILVNKERVSFTNCPVEYLSISTNN